MLTARSACACATSPILANLTIGVLLIFCGVNVPLDELPRWMHDDRAGLPLTHAIGPRGASPTAPRSASVGTVARVELALGVAYLARRLRAAARGSRQGRRHATLDRA